MCVHVCVFFYCTHVWVRAHSIQTKNKHPGTILTSTHTHRLFTSYYVVLFTQLTCCSPPVLAPCAATAGAPADSPRFPPSFAPCGYSGCQGMLGCRAVGLSGCLGYGHTRLRIPRCARPLPVPPHQAMVCSWEMHARETHARATHVRARHARPRFETYALASALARPRGSPSSKRQPTKRGRRCRLASRSWRWSRSQSLS